MTENNTASAEADYKALNDKDLTRIARHQEAIFEAARGRFERRK